MSNDFAGILAPRPGTEKQAGPHTPVNEGWAKHLTGDGDGGTAFKSEAPVNELSNRVMSEMEQEISQLKARLHAFESLNQWVFRHSPEGNKLLTLLVTEGRENLLETVSTITPALKREIEAAKARRENPTSGRWQDLLTPRPE